VVGAASDRFGYAVALDGDTAIVGAYGVGTGWETGAAYVFVRDPVEGWKQQVERTPGDVDDYKEFGCAVSFNGTCVVVGASGDAGDSGSEFEKGAAYLISRSGTGWTQPSKLTAWDGVAQDYFGIAVAVSDDWVLVGRTTTTTRGINRVPRTSSSDRRGSEPEREPAALPPVHRDALERRVGTQARASG